MKNLLSRSSRKFRFSPLGPARITGLLVVAVVFAGLALWAQSRPQPDNGTPDDELNRELARWALTDPEGYNAAVDKLKTPEERAAEELAALAITHPVEYYETFVEKDADRLAAEAFALYAISDPFTATAEAEQNKDEARKQLEAEAARAIRQAVVPGQD